MKGDINKTAIADYIHTSSTVLDAESEIAHILDLPTVTSDSFVSTYEKRLRFIKIAQLAEVESWLARNKDFIKTFVVEWYTGAKENQRTFLPIGITVGFFCWAIAYQNGGFESLYNCVRHTAFTKNVDSIKLAKSFELAYIEATKGGPTT